MFLSWRDIKIRYKQTALGIAWAVVPSVMTMIVFSIVFGRFAGIPSEGRPYAAFAFTALVPWTFFSVGLTQSANSLVGNSSLITKIYFPRMAIPVAAILSAVADLVIALLVLVGLIVYFGLGPSSPLAMVAVPSALLLTGATALGGGLWLSALNVRFRDVRHAVPFLTQIWLFVTPIAYPSDLVPPAWRAVYYINPMATVVDLFRWAGLGTDPLEFRFAASSVASAIFLLVTGVMYFRRAERTFADVI